MKTLQPIICVLVFFLGTAVQAQVAVNINVGSPPQWGPAGYTEVHYYYLPDVEAYYDIHTSMFVYHNGKSWTHRTSLPARYRNYDLYGGYKVVLADYHGNAPYTLFNEHKIRYGKGYRGQPQKTIGLKPAKGNSRTDISDKTPSYKPANPGKDNNTGHNNNKNKKNDQGRGNGKKYKP